MIRVRISATIDHEYENRCPDFLPLDKLREGVCDVTPEEARAILADAEFNSDLSAVDVGEYGVPLGTFNAYRALAKQVRKSLEIAGHK
jgi:hypothetical protein